METTQRPQTATEKSLQGGTKNKKKKPHEPAPHVRDGEKKSQERGKCQAPSKKKMLIKNSLFYSQSDSGRRDTYVGVDQTHGGGKLLLGMCKSKISGEEEGVFPLWRFYSSVQSTVHTLT